MEAIYIIAAIIIFAGGVITGVYVSSQIESHIEKRINGGKRKQLHWSLHGILWHYTNNNNHGYI